MAIWKVIVAGLFALLIATPSYADQCVSMDKFVETIRPANPAFMIAKREAQQKAIKKLNQNRAANGNPAVDAKLLLIGVIKLQDCTFHVAVAMFDENGCAVKETVVFLTLEQWADFAVSAGIEAEDFVVLQDS